MDLSDIMRLVYKLINDILMSKLCILKLYLNIVSGKIPLTPFLNSEPPLATTVFKKQLRRTFGRCSIYIII